jgi:hypothetical protein
MLSNDSSRAGGIKGKLRRFFRRSPKPGRAGSPPSEQSPPASSGEVPSAYEQIIHPDLKPADDDAPLIERLKSSVTAGFGTFKVVLKIAAESSDWNPIVKSVLGGVTALLEHFDVGLRLKCVPNCQIKLTFFLCRLSEMPRTPSRNWP